MMARAKKTLVKENLPEIKTKEEVCDSTMGAVVVSTPVEETVLPAGTDRVGSVAQKEAAAVAVGLSRRKYVAVIVELLEAKVEKVVGRNEFGDEIRETVPDMEKRAKGAELAGKFFNDYKEQLVTTGNVYNKVVYQWLSAPSAGVVATRV